MQQEPSGIIDPTTNKPVERDSKCPRCRAGRERRVRSCGFGQPHDVCGQCGHEFQESTV